MAEKILDNMEYSTTALAQAAYVTNTPVTNLLSNDGLETWPTETASNIMQNPKMDSWGTTELIANNGFETWTDSSHCTSWFIWSTSGDAVLARESTIVKSGTYSAKLTAATNSSNTNIACEITNAGGHNLAYWKGRAVTYGAWVYATVPNRARVQIYDGVSNAVSSFHTGNSTWQWLTVTYTIASTATAVYLINLIDSGTVSTSIYVDVASCVEISNLIVNDSFETYTTTPGAPDSWAHYQDGTGGSAAKETTEKKYGSNSCKITKSNSGNSFIQQAFTATSYRSKVIVIGVWVKSATSVANTVVLYVYDDGTGGVWDNVYYQNSAGWEYITVTHAVKSDATNIAVLCLVNTSANAVAYFDGVECYEQIAPRTFVLNNSTTPLSSASPERNIVHTSGGISMKLKQVDWVDGSDYLDCYEDITNLGLHDLTYWKSKVVITGCWVYATVANRARIFIHDGAGGTYSAYHTGNSTWQYLSISRTISSSATYVLVVCQIYGGNTSCYFDDMTAYESLTPTNWTLGGTDGGVEREATIVKSGTYSGKLTRVVSDCWFNQNVTVTPYKGTVVTFGAWVYATVASRVFVQIYDGVNTTNSSYHTGDSTWQFLQVSASISSSATALSVALCVYNGNTSGYIDGAQLISGYAMSDSYNGLNYLNSFSESTIKTQGSNSLKALVSKGSNIISNADLKDEDMADISDWTDNDAGTGVSSQATYDSKSCMKLESGTYGTAQRTIDVGTFGTRTVMSMNVYCDSIGTDAEEASFFFGLSDGTTTAYIRFNSDGLWVYDGSVYNEVGTNIVVQDVWQEWTFDFNWTAKTVDIYLNKVLVQANVDCSNITAGTNGTLAIFQQGRYSVLRTTYIDWVKIGSVPTFTSLVTTPVGGTKTTDGLYTVHKFTTTGTSTFTVPCSGLIDILVVAGGGGGGGAWACGAGGGGGGGLVYSTGVPITPGNHTITVGTGGVGAGNADTVGGTGVDSTFDTTTIVAKGGGGGGGYNSSDQSGNATIGGSGGGGGSVLGTLGAEALGSQGHAGGNGILTDGDNVNARAGGGGGGADVVGSTAGRYYGGNGGDGLAYDIVLEGTDVYYAGGGGGGIRGSGYTVGNGGSGGGGAGSKAGATATTGTANTGGGGGGGGGNGISGTGGTGIVVIRYLTSDFTIPQINRVIASPINLSGIKLFNYDVRASRVGSNFKIGFRDSGGTITEHTPNIAVANTWQTEVVDISGVSDANKDAIDTIIITPRDATVDNTIYIDNIGATYDIFGMVDKKASTVIDIFGVSI